MVKVRAEVVEGLKIWLVERPVAERRQLIVLFHGYGAPGSDLVPLARELNVDVLAFPEAPFDLSGGLIAEPPRAWWHIDIERIQLASRTGRINEFVREVPDGMREAGAVVDRALTQLGRDLGIPDERIVIGGFSQGAMLATDLALSFGRRFRALVILSGTLVAADQWLPELQRRTFPVFISHGQTDPILPFLLAERFAHALEPSAATGPEVEWVPFPGEHGIPRVVLSRLNAFLGRVFQLD